LRNKNAEKSSQKQNTSNENQNKYSHWAKKAQMRMKGKQ
jgi:hypothetical protein